MAGSMRTIEKTSQQFNKEETMTQVNHEKRREWIISSLPIEELTKEQLMADNIIITKNPIEIILNFMRMHFETGTEVPATAALHLWAKFLQSLLNDEKR